MAKIENGTLLKVCTAIAKAKSPDTGVCETWDSEDSAIACVKTILEENGDKEMLASTPEAIAHRKALVKAIIPLMTAAVNFRRQYLVEAKLATKPTETADRVKEYC